MIFSYHLGLSLTTGRAMIDEQLDLQRVSKNQLDSFVNVSFPFPFNWSTKKKETAPRVLNKTIRVCHSSTLLHAFQGLPVQPVRTQDFGTILSPQPTGRDRRCFIFLTAEHSHFKLSPSHLDLKLAEPFLSFSHCCWSAWWMSMLLYICLPLAFTLPISYIDARLKLTPHSLSDCAAYYNNGSGIEQSYDICKAFLFMSGGLFLRAHTPETTSETRSQISQQPPPPNNEALNIFKNLTQASNIGKRFRLPFWLILQCHLKVVVHSASTLYVYDG